MTHDRSIDPAKIHSMPHRPSPLIARIRNGGITPTKYIKLRSEALFAVLFVLGFTVIGMLLLHIGLSIVEWWLMLSPYPK